MQATLGLRHDHVNHSASDARPATRLCESQCKRRSACDTIMCNTVQSTTGLRHDHVNCSKFTELLLTQRESTRWYAQGIYAECVLALWTAGEDHPSLLNTPSTLPSAAKVPRRPRPTSCARSAWLTLTPPHSPRASHIRLTAALTLEWAQQRAAQHLSVSNTIWIVARTIECT